MLILSQFFFKDTFVTIHLHINKVFAMLSKAALSATFSLSHCSQTATLTP